MALTKPVLYRNLGVLCHNLRDVSYSTLSSLKTLQDVPTPKGSLPLLGHYLHVQRCPGNLSALYEQYFKELGPIFRLEFPGKKSIVCFADPNGLESVYRVEGEYPVRTYTAPANFGWYYQKKNLPVPFVFQKGKLWKESRSKHRNQSTPGNVHKHIPGFVKATQRLLRNIKETCTTQDGFHEDVHSLMMNWGIEVSAHFTLGVDLDCMKTASLPETMKFREGFTTLVSTIDDFITALPFFKIFPSKIVNRLNEATDNLYSIGQKYIDSHHDNTTSEHSLINQWLREGQMTKEEINMSAIFMMGAGGETAPLVSSYALYELAKCRDVQDKMYNQVMSVLGMTGSIDSESLQKMTYLGHVIKETQRLNPVSPHHIRTVPKDVNILGYTIPAETTTMYSMTAVAKNENYFKNPLKFDPDRWSRDNIHPFAIAPFGIGPRSCWGRRFAEVEIKILLAEICRNFVLESNESQNEKLKTKEKLFARPAAPIKIRFIPRHK